MDSRIVENEGLKNWADLQNMLIAASAYANTSSLAELNAQIDLIKDRKDTGVVQNT